MVKHTPLEAINLLKVSDDIKEKIRYYCSYTFGNKGMHSKRFSIINDVLLLGFHWAETSEGDEYWGDLYVDLNYGPNGS